MVLDGLATFGIAGFIFLYQPEAQERKRAVMPNLSLAHFDSHMVTTCSSLGLASHALTCRAYSTKLKRATSKLALRAGLDVRITMLNLL